VKSTQNCVQKTFTLAKTEKKEQQKNCKTKKKFNDEKKKNVK